MYLRLYIYQIRIFMYIINIADPADRRLSIVYWNEKINESRIEQKRSCFHRHIFGRIFQTFKRFKKIITEGLNSSGTRSNSPPSRLQITSRCFHDSAY